MLREAGKGYVLGHCLNHQVFSRRSSPTPLATFRRTYPGKAWRRLSATAPKGPRLYDWAYLSIHDLEAGELNDR